MPLTLGILLLLLAVWYLYRQKQKQAERYLLIAVLWISLITYAPFSNLLLSTLESRYDRVEQIPQNVEYILLLGGDREQRAWEAVRLYHMQEGLKIVTSGFSMHDKESDALKTARLLEESGIPKEHIVMQENVKDTKEEAWEMKKKVGDRPFLLVTAAYHMPRAMILFEKEGLKPIAAPADFNNPDENGLFTIWQGEQLRKTEHAWHEYLGLIWTKLRG